MKVLMRTVITALVALSGTDARANLVTNGSFETGAPAAGCVAGTTTLTGWTVGTGNVDVDSKAAGCSGMSAADGFYFVDLTGSGGGGAGSIYQTVSTTPGQQYLLGFYFGGNPAWQYNSYPYGPYPNDGSIKSMNVLLNGNLLGTFGIDTTGFAATFPGWTHDQLYFTANSSATQLRFTSLNGANGTVYGPLLDGVSLDAVPGKPSVVPLPASAWLMLGALGGLALLVRQRERSADY
ncbi:MAG: DUF642 domain-containing protein [Steroidobacteraceae bacterium]